ncbi:hypothetical protein RJ640_014525 [Escallonia rubra]|uniref:PdxS/SNZ N-terminal domain-containing protein n=1 Tax=Escallonia rubra TaxID=112253 RepID=A0AA88U2S4_9ASTE|nr:hypothetical protein RJ640_014525 [Escallonia rubra]
MAGSGVVTVYGNGAITEAAAKQSPFSVKVGLAQMLRGGVIMDVVNAEQARIAEEAGACAVMALERVPADIRAQGGVARMSDPQLIKEIKQAVTIPVMAKARIGHFVEAQILEAIGVDYVDESESKKSWQARHTGIKIVQQIEILIGCAVLPHLRSEHGLNDGNQKVRTITALSLAALAEASAPYGTESFDSVLKTLWKEGVESDHIRSDILPEFFRNFWVRRMALDRRNYRRMVMETIEKVAANLGASDIDARLEEQLIDGILHAFQEQTSDDANVMLNGFGAVVNALGQRVKPYLPQICGTVKWRLNNKSAKVRQQAADLISRIAVVMKQCQEEQLMGHLGVVLYEYLGEEYPLTIALKAIVNVFDVMDNYVPERSFFDLWMVVKSFWFVVSNAMRFFKE